MIIFKQTIWKDICKLIMTKIQKWKIKNKKDESKRTQWPLDKFYYMQIWYNLLKTNIKIRIKAITLRQKS